MTRRGWIYFREDAGRGYCFGKTANPARRDAEYSKENPFIKKLGAFEVGDIDAVEQELILLTAHLRLLPNSKEWLHFSTEVLDIFAAIRERYALLTHAEWDQRQGNQDSVGTRHTPSERQRQPVFQQKPFQLAAPTVVLTPPERIQQLFRYCPKCKRRMSYRIAQCNFFCAACESTQLPSERQGQPVLQQQPLWLASVTFVPTPTERIQQLHRYCQQCKRRMSYRIARCSFFCPDCEPAAERKPLGLLSLIALWLRWLAR